MQCKTNNRPNRSSIILLIMVLYLLGMLNATISSAQSIESPPFVTQTFKIQYRHAADIQKIILPYCLTEPGVSHTLNTITIRCLQKDLPQIESIIESYDVPLMQVWLEVSLIHAKGNGDKKALYDPELEHIVKKLKSLFRFGQYKIIGRADAMGLETSELNFGSNTEEVNFEVATQIECPNSMIRLNNLTVALFKPHHNRLSTSINIQNGETVILGASRSDALEGSLITVVTAKVME